MKSGARGRRTPNMRSFIALEISLEARDAIAEFQRELRRVDPAVSWTRPENLHLTLRFLGELDDSIATAVGAALADAVGELQPFDLELSHPGVFPDLRRPRVVWVGLKGELDRLNDLRIAVEKAVEPFGYPAEKAAFRPHLTIGRVKGERNIREMLARSELYVMPRVRFASREIVLFRSDLQPGGSRYTAIRRAALGYKQLS
ncbi:MAG: RNA 2',3'-cyclic phosphodiesterase [Blastocatellales bacterium]